MINHLDAVQNRRLEKTNVANFKAAFGKHPLHLCRIWRDLQTTNIAEAHLPEDYARSKDGLLGFFLGWNLLKCYTSHSVRASLFQGIDITRCADLSWQFVERISALLPEKVFWPAHWDETLAASIDGTQCATNEPKKEHMRKNSANYSFKFHMPGRNHEIALDLWRNRCVHAKLSDRASVNDLTAFRQQLKGLAQAAGVRIIGDRGYISFIQGDDDVLSIPNPMDPPRVKEFKANFNARLKDFKCLKNVFIHGIEKQQMCFYAVVVAVQYAIEDTGPFGEPLNQL